MNDEIDKLFYEMKQKLLNMNNPTLVKIWMNYLKKHTILYKRVINEVDKFIINEKCDLNDRDILLLYLLNDINI
jgi:hypothetical protein|tara:strand:- start:90 stop:311 length:222 start_codon:yes stop_codon:yes gene_type:complete